MADNRRKNTGRQTGQNNRRTTGKSSRKTGRTTNSQSGRRTQVQEDEILDYALRSEITVIILFALMIFLFLCNFGVCGSIGKTLSGVLFGIFGVSAYVVPLLIFALAAFYISNQGSHAAMRKIAAACTLFFLIEIITEMVSGRLTTYNGYDAAAIFRDAVSNRNGGGFIGGSLAYFCYHTLSMTGSVILIIVLGTVSIVILTEHSVIGSIKSGGAHVMERAGRDAEDYRERRQINLQRHEQLREEKRKDKKAEDKEAVRRSFPPDLRMEEKSENKVRKFPIKSAVQDVNDDTVQNTDNISVQNINKNAAQNPNQGAAQTINQASGKSLNDGIVQHTDISHSEPVVHMSEPAIQISEPSIGLHEATLITEEEHKEDIHEITIKSYANVQDAYQNREDEAEMTAAADQTETTSFRTENFAGRSTQKSMPPLPVPDDFFPGKTSGVNPAGISASNSGLAGISASNSGPAGISASNSGSAGISALNSSMADDMAADTNTESDDFSDIHSKASAVRNDSDADEDEIEDEEPLYENPSDRIQIHRAETEVNDGYTVHTQEHISPSGSSNADDRPRVSRLPSSYAAAGNNVSEMRGKKVKHKKYVFPPVDLLNKGQPNLNKDSEQQLKETASKLESTLRSFGVNVTVTDVSQGPSVTRYELQPEVGVKVSKIVNLADDIKMNLAATDIRIEAPIPGKPAVGIEVPNKDISTVAFRDLIESSEYRNFNKRLAFAVGKDIEGKTVVTDIAKMPHLLIAGATGSGKSVCINTLIMSIIYKSPPEQVGLIMIDPKVVELSVYNGIPQLLIPVVTDPKKAAAALNWAVKEMSVRYKKFADAEVRDLKGYNEYVDAHKDDDESLIKMPQIVIIVDELADLMMVAASEVEEAICRLAQLARAAGIHLIIATQRPSVDVITGLIKANMPSRIAFAVSSGIDSRTILDMNGAEKLLGKGDMLFYPQNYSKPVRVQGAFISDQEIQRITDFLKKQSVETEYGSDIQSDIKSIESSGDGNSQGGNAPERDEYFDEAAELIIDKEKASIGMLQRVFKIGFNRAARIMDQLCEAGIVSDDEGTKPRKVMMSRAQFDDMRNNSQENGEE